MLRLAVIVLMIPTVCDPPEELPPYTCRQLPEEVDFGEAQTFARASRFINLDSRDRPKLSEMTPPFGFHPVSTPQFALSLDFTPLDAQQHFDSVTMQLHPDCPAQTVRLVGRGSGAVETPQSRFELGELQRFQPVEITLPLTNTRREPVDVSLTELFAEPNRIEFEPATFSMQPFERREVIIRVTCLHSDGTIFQDVTLKAPNQRLSLTITATCVP